MERENNDANIEDKEIEEKLKKELDALAEKQSFQPNEQSYLKKVQSWLQTWRNLQWRLANSTKQF